MLFISGGYLDRASPSPVAPLNVLDTSGTVYAGLRRQLAAFLLDLFLIYILIDSFLIISIYSPFMLLTTYYPFLWSAAFIHRYAFAAAASLLPLVYFVYCWGAKGQTLGDRLFRISVVKAGGNPGTGYTAALLRLAGAIVSAAFFGLGFLWMIWDPQKQTWHDKLAKTRVVKV